MKSSFQKWVPVVAAVAVGAFASTAVAQQIPPEKVKNAKSLVQYWLWEEYGVTLKQANYEQFLGASQKAIATSGDFNNGKIKPSAVVKEVVKYNPQYSPGFAKQSLSLWVSEQGAADKKAIKEWSNIVKNAFTAGLKDYKKAPSPGNPFQGAADKAAATAALTAQVILAVKDVPPQEGSSKTVPVSPLQYIVANTVKLAGKAKVAKGNPNTGTAAFGAGLMVTLAGNQNNDFNSNTVLAAVLKTATEVAGAKKAAEIAYGAAYGFAAQFIASGGNPDDFNLGNATGILQAILSGFKKAPKPDVEATIVGAITAGFNYALDGATPGNPGDQGPGYKGLFPVPVTDIQGL